MRRAALGILLFVACSKPQAAQVKDASPAPVSLSAVDASLGPDAGVPGTIGTAGGRIEAAGAVLDIPAGALKEERVFRIARVPADKLGDWPRGTAAGFVLEPEGEPFRLPVTIELPHEAGVGEVMCEVHGERQIEWFDETSASRPFRFHVGELPHRCAVYSAEHAKARRAAHDTEEAIVEKQNHAHKWEIKGKVCDPHQLVRPNAGKDIREPPGLGGCPAGMAPIPGKPACVDRWEAHLVEVLDDGTEHTWSPYFNPGTLRVRAKSGPGAIPQGYVSAVQAEAACKEANKRLCQDEEWVAACKGSRKTQFPYGNEEHRGTCNDARDQHPAMQYLESRDLSVFTKLEHPCINQLPDSLLPTGEKRGCATPEGDFDMVGNLHEWTADPSGHFRGGYYVDTWLNGHGCDYLTTAHEARYWDYSTGFRCCASKGK